MAKKTASTRRSVATATRRGSKKPKDSCFTIMPFGGWFDGYYATIYRPAIKAAGFEPTRADDLYRPSTIVTDIWNYTKAAKIVLADLTGKNPNVFYELGLAHALAKPVILVTASMDDVPFDLRSLRVLEYDKNEPNWGDILTKKISKSIEEVLKTPLSSVLPAFLKVKPEAKARVVSPQDKALLELRQELDVLRQQLRPQEMLRIPTNDPEYGVVLGSEAHMYGRAEAEALVRRGLRIGVRDELILEELRNHGVPDHFARGLLNALKETMGKARRRKRGPLIGRPAGGVRK